MKVPAIPGRDSLAILRGRETRGRGAGRRRLAEQPLGFWLAAIWLAALVFFVLFAPVLGFLADPDGYSRNVLQGVGRSHWFGTDELGRDMFARVVWGGRLSLLIAAIAVAVGILVGGLMGLLAGFFGGWVDTALSAVINILLSLPALILALFIVTVLEQNTRNVIIAVTILAARAVARIVRAQTLRFREREFVTAARCMGARTSRLLFREVLPNLIPIVVAFTFLGLGLVIVGEGGLSFIGKSVPSPAITWGGILAVAKGKLADAPHLTIYPAIVMFCTLMSVNYIGDTLMRRFDVRQSLI
ncbi:MAG: ABC transporter permease [Acidimicrobiia bacterium]|nr:ABC transporter permease [Acidimicrobiia bacterium]